MVCYLRRTAGGEEFHTSSQLPGTFSFSTSSEIFWPAGFATLRGRGRVVRRAIHVLRTKPSECGRVRIMISRLKSLLWSKTILCRVKFLLHMRDRYIWRRVAVIGLLKTIRAWTKATVCCSKGKDSVPGCLRSLRVVIASQARGIGHAGA